MLVVDDEESIRDVVSYYLKKEGYNVITSQNGEEAIDLLKECTPSLAITDLRMPKVDGFGVMDYVREHCGFMPVIVLTGYVDLDLAVSAMKKGCFDYITKPIKKEALINVVKKALAKMREDSKSRSFEIGEFYLMRDDGRVMLHEKIRLKSDVDTEFFGFILTVVKSLVKNSMGKEGGLKGLEHADMKVLIEEGEGYFLTVIGQGEDMEPVKATMKKTMKTIDNKYDGLLTEMEADAKEWGDIRSILDNLRNMGKEDVKFDPNNPA